LGIAISPSKNGASSNLYIINHGRDESTIEHFTLTPEASPNILPTLRYVRTILSSSFVAPNALALTSDHSFYVTNDHLFTSRLPIVGKFLPMMETLFGLPFAWTAHVTLDSDPQARLSNAVKSSIVAAPFIASANGIALSPTTDDVAIASTSLGMVYIYTRHPLTNKLTYKDRVRVPFATDNLHYHEDGRTIIAAGHPQALEILNPKTRRSSPSWIVAITPATHTQVTPASDEAPVPAPPLLPTSQKQNYNIVTLFQSSGKSSKRGRGFPTSSTAMIDSRDGVMDGALFVSGLYADEGVIICTATHR
jgi:hypothetical protein